MDTLTRALCLALSGQPLPEQWQGAPPEDWGRLAASAKAHGVEGLLQRALSRSGWPPTMPEAARAALRAAVYQTAGHNMRVYRTLDVVLAAVGAAAPLVVLKGPALAPWLYPATTLRPVSDIDLLVPPDAVEAVATRLRGLGFHLKPSLAPELARAIDPHIVMLGGLGGAVSVEVHWSLLAGSAHRNRVPVEWFWGHTEPWQPPPGHAPAPAARQLTPTAALLYQCAHLVIQHGREPARLVWIYDLHLLAGSGRVNWADLVEQARRLNWGPVVYTALEEARRCFGTLVGQPILDALRGPLDPRVHFRGAGETGHEPYTTWNSLAELDLPTRARFLARVVLPSRAYLREQYEPLWGPWWPLAYPYRWIKPIRQLVAGRQKAKGRP